MGLAGLSYSRLGWAGLGYVGLGWLGFARVGLGRVGLGWVVLGPDGLGRVESAMSQHGSDVLGLRWFGMGGLLAMGYSTCVTSVKI